MNESNYAFHMAINEKLFFFLFSKIVELEEELRVVGNNLKSLEVSEEKVYILNSIYSTKKQTRM